MNIVKKTLVEAFSNPINRRLLIQFVFSAILLYIPAAERVGQGLISAFGGTLLGYTLFEFFTTGELPKTEKPDYRAVVALSLFLGVFLAVISLAAHLL